MKFYTNVYTRGNSIYVRGYENGKAVQFVEHYKPYLFLPKTKDSNKIEYRTLEGKPMNKLVFDGIKDAKDFVAKYKEVDNFDFFGLTNFQYVFLYDYYPKTIEYDPSLLSIVTIDIECAADEGFPNIQLANKEITAITLRKKGHNIVLGCGTFVTKDPNTLYIKCKDEKELLEKFLQSWTQLNPDVVTGWNIDLFDIPYTINRIRNVLGEEHIKRLSPWRIVYDREISRGKQEVDIVYEIVGVTALDYYQLYKKFSFGNQESYKLDYIAQVELGEKKLDYSEYGSLLELYKNNFQKFIEYNIVDCELVERLDEKLKFIEQVMALAYDAKVNYADTMTTVRAWDVIIHNYLMDRRIVIPQFKKKTMFSHLVGGHVKEVIPGMYKWVVSFDLNSLYPHLIMQYNISPETFIQRIAPDCFPTLDELLDGDGPNTKYDYTFTGNGCCYSKDKQGFLPALMETMYNDRVRYKKLMIEAKKRYEQTKDPTDAMLVARYHNMQLAKKIQLNSAYGALGNEWFRWFSFNNAEAITMSGQLSIRWIEKKMNEYMNKMLRTENIDYVIASDTDSIYVTMETMVKTLNTDDEMVIVGAIDAFCEKKIQPFIDKCYQELATMMNAYQQKMQMKRETIANKGIWKAAKNYILNAWNIEGVQYSEPKLKMQGIEAVRSSTPYVCRENIKKSLSIIMNGEQTDLQKYILDFKSEFMGFTFEQVAFPRGITDLDKWADHSNLYKKGTPIHVKGSLLFNSLLNKYKIKNIPPIKNGDKVKFAYLKMPNPMGDTVIATHDVLPTEFGLDKYIDYDVQFEKAFIAPLKAITDVINWDLEKRSTLESFFR